MFCCNDDQGQLQNLVISNVYRASAFRQASFTERAAWDARWLRPPPAGKDYEIFWADGRAVFHATRDEFGAWLGSQGDWEELVHVFPVHDPAYVPVWFNLPASVACYFEWGGWLEVADNYTPSLRERAEAGEHHWLDYAKWQSLQLAFRKHLFDNQGFAGHSTFHLLPEAEQRAYVERWVAANRDAHPNDAWFRYMKYKTPEWARSVAGRDPLPPEDIDPSFSVRSAAIDYARTRSVDLYEIPKLMVKTILDYVRSKWSATLRPKAIGFHWHRARKGYIVARSVTEGGRYADEKVDVLAAVEEAFLKLGIDDFRVRALIRNDLKDRDKSFVSDCQFSIVQGSLRRLEITFNLNGKFPFAKVRRMATVNGISTLGHEMTHARQAAEGYFVGNVDDAVMRREPLRYYLQPIETEAHVREIVNSSRQWGTSFEKECRMYLGYTRAVGRKLTADEREQIAAGYNEWYNTHYAGREELPIRRFTDAVK